MTSYPALFDVTPPERFERVQLVLRLVVGAVLGLINVSLGWIFGLLYLTLPAMAAIVVGSTGVRHYLEVTGPSIERFLRWLLSFQAYMVFLTDRFPTGNETLVRFEIRPTGTPTPGSSLMRLLTSIPEIIVLAILGFFAGIVCFLSFLTVLLTESVPAPFLSFQRGLLRWQARLLAYHASLVETAPPYAIDGGPEARATV